MKARQHNSLQFARYHTIVGGVLAGLTAFLVLFQLAVLATIGFHGMYQTVGDWVFTFAITPGFTFVSWWSFNRAATLRR